MNIAEVRMQFLTQYQFDPTKLYCLHTGKPIGIILFEEFESTVAEIAINCTDLESIADDLAMRILASMRPSLKWNKLRDSTLPEMRVNQPVETLAYLLNKLMTPSRDDNTQDFFQVHRTRILTYQQVSRLTKEQVDEMTHLLLEIEAKLNLEKEVSPLTIDAPPKESWFTLTMSLLRPWHAKRVAFHAKAEADAQWFAANPGARKAFYASWMERAPPSETAVKKAEKQREVNYMSSMLDALLNPGSQNIKPVSQRVEPAAPAPAVLASTKMPTRFGIKRVEG